MARSRAPERYAGFASGFRVRPFRPSRRKRNTDVRDRPCFLIRRRVRCLSVRHFTPIFFSANRASPTCGKPGRAERRSATHPAALCMCEFECTGKVTTKRRASQRSARGVRRLFPCTPRRRTVLVRRSSGRLPDGDAGLAPAARHSASRSAARPPHNDPRNMWRGPRPFGWPPGANPARHHRSDPRPASDDADQTPPVNGAG